MGLVFLPLPFTAFLPTTKFPLVVLLHTSCQSWSALSIHHVQTVRSLIQSASVMTMLWRDAKVASAR